MNANETDWLAELFGATPQTSEEIAAGLARMAAEEAARLAGLRAAEAARLAAQAAARCPKCAGRGRLPQFQHIKGGECFACGATGLFSRF